MKTDVTPEKALNRKGRGKLLLTIVAIVGTIVFQIIGFIFSAVMSLPSGGLEQVTAIQAFSAGGAVLGMALLGGAKWLSTSREDLGCMWRAGWVILAADAILMCISIVEYLTDGSLTIAANWLPNLAFTALICACIGIYEETLYRGLILNGLLAMMGKSHKGTMLAVAVTSVLFGFGHVSISTDFASGMLAAQAILKIVQTGLFSVIMCSVVLRTHRLGAVSIFHGLSDFLLMVPSLVLAGEQLTTEYVSAGDDGVVIIIFYVITIAFYLPFAIIGLRHLHRDHVTYRGAFMEKAVAELEERQDDGPDGNGPDHGNWDGNGPDGNNTDGDLLGGIAAAGLTMDDALERQRAGLPIPPTVR